MEYVIGQTINLKRTGLPTGNGIKPGAVPAKDSRTITGVCSVFGNIDSGNDVVVPGAFAKAVADFNAGRSRCRFLWNHNTSDPPIATVIELRELRSSDLPPDLRSKVDVNGALQVTRKYFTDPFSDRVYQGVTTRGVSEMSFAYNPIDFSYENVKGQKVRVLKSVELMECSDVLWGMNPFTMASTGKGAYVLTSAKVDELKKIRAKSKEQKESLEQLIYSLPKEAREKIEEDRKFREMCRQLEALKESSRRFEGKI